MNRDSKFFKKIRKRHIKVYFLIMIFSALSAFLSAFPLKILKNIIDEMINDYGSKGIPNVINRLFMICITYVLCILVGYLLTNFQTYISSRMRIKISNEIRVGIFEYLIELKQSFFDNADSSELLGIIMQDSDIIAQGIISPIINISKAIFSFGFGIYFMSQIDILLTIIILPITLVSGIIAGISSGKLKVFSKENRRRNTIMWQFSTESIQGMRDIHSIGKEDNVKDEFKVKSNYMEKNEISTEKYKLKIDIINNITLIALLSVSLFIGAWLVVKNQISIGSMVAILTYNTLLTVPIQGLVFVFQDLSKVRASSERTKVVLGERKDDKYLYKSVVIPDKSDIAVEFKSVVFGYANERIILNNMNFKVFKNQMCAFVGNTGCGKTTILKICDAIYDVVAGDVLLYGNKVTSATKIALTSRISYAFQETYLFNSSILDNIKFSNPFATDSELKKAISASCVDEIISKLPNGVETIVGEGGVFLSGGERQRIGIARMLLKKSDIMLMDEATSALDNQTERTIMDNIRKHYKDKTFLIVAHRLTSIVEADKIFVISSGKVMEEGVHKDLMEKNTKYKQLYNANKNFFDVN